MDSKAADRQTQFVALMEQHRGLVRKVAGFWKRSPHDREELEQQIHLEAWRSFAGWNPERKFSTWLYRVALNVAISEVRKSRLRRMASFTEVDDMANLAAADTQLAEQVRELYHVADQLLPLERSLMLLYLEDCSQREMAEVLGITEANVATKIHRLKHKLKQLLNPSSERGG